MKILKRIPLWIKEPIYMFFRDVREKLFKIALLHSLCNFRDNRNSSPKVTLKTYRRYHRAVSDYLEKKYLNIILERAALYTSGQKPENPPVWVFWWQGEAAAPEIVKICLDRIRKNAGDRRVIVIDEHNYRQYVELPDHVEEKHKKKTFSLTHFSDILRMKLLAKGSVKSYAQI